MKGIDAQVLSPADAKEYVRACDDSTDEDREEARIGEISPADAAKEIDAQAFSTTDAEEKVDAQALSSADPEEDALNGHDSTTDAAKDIDAQALSPADAKEYVRSCDDSTADAVKAVDAQALSSADAEEDALNGHDSTTDAAKDIDAQVLSPADAKEYVRACDNSTTDTAKDIDAQAFSPADAKEDIAALPFSADKGRWGVRSPRGPDPPTGDGHDSTDTGNDFTDAGNDFADADNDFTNTGNDFADAENHFTAQPPNFSADRHSPAAVSTAPAAVGTARAVDPPIFAADECRSLRTLTEKHPYLNPSFHEPHPLLRLHPPSIGGFGRTFRVQSAQPPFGRPFLGRFVDIRPACTVGSRPLRPRLALCRTERGRCRLEHPDRECTTSANAAERSANAIRPPEDGHEHGTDERKNADFIDADPVRGHKTERNADEHANDERKRHDSAAEHPAYDLDAGQRLLDTAAHRRAVRAEREACCGALRHLAHCCVAF